MAWVFVDITSFGLFRIVIIDFSLMWAGTSRWLFLSKARLKALCIFALLSPFLNATLA